MDVGIVASGEVRCGLDAFVEHRGNYMDDSGHYPGTELFRVTNTM
jgi:hypothetical protein